MDRACPITRPTTPPRRGGDGFCFFGGRAGPPVLSPRVRLGCHGIETQHLHQVRNFAQMPQGIAEGFIVAAEQVYKKYVFPGTAAHGPRFDLAQADVAQREYAKSFEERSGNIFYAEGERGLVRTLRRAPLSALDQEKAGEVFLVVLNARFQDLSLVDFGGAAAGYACTIAQTSDDDVL